MQETHSQPAMLVGPACPLVRGLQKQAEWSILNDLVVQALPCSGKRLAEEDSPPHRAAFRRYEEANMIDKQLAAILVCPENQTPLELAEDELIARLNRAIAAGKLKNRAGHAVERPLQGGLVRQDQTLLYPVVDDIPVLLVDEAILLEQIRG